MSQDFNSKLEKVLKADDRFIDGEGDLLKPEVIDKAYKYDKKLVELLLDDKDLKQKFFIEIKEHWVFNINDFVAYIQDKNFLNDSYTKFKNKIGLNIDGKFLNERGEVSLVWPFKDCVLEGGMTKEDQKRNEIFFNEILAKDEIDRLFDAKVLTNFKKYTAKGEEKVKDFNRDEKGTIKDNLIIKGNNLLALHSLKKEFAGKVKLIYIDPPYNTGNDSFKYNDSFNHSTWLTFMKNRLEVARDLLRDDGVIFVQCDDNEQAYLKILLDEIKGFHEEVTLYVQVRYEGKSLTEKNDYQKLIEHIFVYSKESFKPIKDEEEYLTDKFCWEIEELSKGEKVKIGHREVTIFKKGEYKITKNESIKNGLKETWASGTVLKNNASGKYFGDYLAPRVEEDGLEVLYRVEGIGEDGLGYRYFTGPKREGATKGKFYSGIPLKRVEEMKNGKAIKLKSIANFYNFADSFGNCRHEGGVELRSGKKPEILLKRILEISTNEDDIVLDFHIGTGVTCAVSHKMGRQYIGIEQLDYGKNDSVIRLKNVIGKTNSKGKLKETIEDFDNTGISKEVSWKGGGEFIYCELLKYNEDAIDKIQDAKDTKSLLKIWDEMCEHYFLNYDVEIKKFNDNKKDFEKMTLKQQKDILVKMLNKNQLYVNLSDIEDGEFDINKGDKEINKEFYS